MKWEYFHFGRVRRKPWNCCKPQTNRTELEHGSIQSHQGRTRSNKLKLNHDAVLTARTWEYFHFGRVRKP